MWGLPLVVLLVGGGLIFTVHSRFLAFRKFKLAIEIIMGKHDFEEKPEGDISHFQALMLALSGTLGLGNITGVAVALTIGGAGAIFWMWVTALVGITTKFYTATLAVKYRGLDHSGHLQGGPMYVIREGLGRRWLPLAWIFCFGGMFGVLPIFQINQLVQVLRDFIAIPSGLASTNDHFAFDLICGLVLCGMISWIVMGKLTRLAAVTSRLVPVMVALYLITTLVLLVLNASVIPAVLMEIVTSAFDGSSVAGGTLGAIIMIGVQRGAFSNEAGIGTESMAHGAAKTNEPVKEGLVATIGPIVDTLIVCSCTAIAILATGVLNSGLSGVSLTVQAYAITFPVVGTWIVVLVVLFLSISTVLTFWYYGCKCAEFMFGPAFQKVYVWFYLSLIVLGAVSSLALVINLIDIMYATMAFPTMISTLLLAPKVKAASKAYFMKKNPDK